jgi:ElaB/YqjD/DUF883 family membrane-anchored ribosome-binding protein
MAEQPEVIQQELEETRHALAEKLGQIGEKISGTVETVSDAVSNVTATVSNVTDAVEGTMQNVADAVSGTVETVQQTVSTVGEKATETVDAVRHAFNLPEQIHNHPWAWFGGAVVLGFVGGKFLVPHRSYRAEAESWDHHGPRAGAAESQAAPAFKSPDESHEETAPQRAEHRETDSSSWLGSLFQHFGGEINKLKGLALGTLFGVTRDMVSQALPETLKDQVVNLFNDVTEKVGGEPIQGAVLGEAAAKGQQSESDKGGDHEHDKQHPEPAKMERPVGAAERKGKERVGHTY